jgi:hypothetical protein
MVVGLTLTPGIPNHEEIGEMRRMPEMALLLFW